ncbi:MAG TPA: hypothetical protein VHO69_00855 [Phototrophicaceae bacterium]|nr:hypothetical protein [Phototrophicaceae bacterium]
MMQKSDHLFICGFVLLVGGLLLIGAPVNAQTCSVSQPLQLVSVALDGTPSGVVGFNEASISADGRYVAFTSYASNLVTEDTNQIQDVFVRDMVAGVTERVSVGPNGLEANGESKYPSLSGDGNLITFESYASNLAADDQTEDCPQQNPSCLDIFVRNRKTGALALVSTAWNSELPAGDSHNSTISGNGRYVAFQSDATNLIATDTNNATDVFVRDLETGSIERVSIASNGVEGNNNSYDPMGISWDGRYITFVSTASNLVENDHNANCHQSSFLCSDVFVHDRVTHQTLRASVTSDGIEANGSSDSPSLSHDGRYMSFVSPASNLAPGDPDDSVSVFLDVFIHDLDTHTTQIASVSGGGIPADSYSNYPSLSFHGRYLAFGVSGPGVSIFVRDTWAGRNLLVSSGLNGQPENGQSHYPAISADGQHVAFWSDSSNLVADDTNNEGNIFVAALNCPADRTPFTPSPLDAVPTRNYSTDDITLTWNRIPWAAQYRIQVDTDKTFQPEFIVNELVGADQLEKTLTGLNPNTYYWRVQALDATGKAGGWSAVESFTIGYPNP